jgi:putative FmdB family regulatory protein
MPTYDYRCTSCGYQFEQFQPISARPLRKCSRCRRNALTRLIGCGAGVIFKGSGFYQTDYRSKSYDKAAEKERSAGAGAAGSDKREAGQTSTKNKPAVTDDAAKTA